ncbi:MAG: ECF transporter S component [Lachnospiraceae bacterium]|nr:ECF transporter S component [Lachnospiraceae bacterium]
MKANKAFDTRTIAELGMLLGITLLMGLTPVGTIPTPFLNVSIVTIPVAIAAIFHGPKGGLICGGAFGLTSLYNAMAGKSVMMAALFAINPLATAFTAIVPRLLEGLLVAIIFNALHRVKRLRSASYYIASLCCPVLNTILFMSCIVMFFYNSDYIQEMVAARGVSNPFSFVVALVGIQGVVEAITCLVIAGTVSQGVDRVLHRR